MLLVLLAHRVALRVWEPLSERVPKDVCRFRHPVVPEVVVVPVHLRVVVVQPRLVSQVLPYSPFHLVAA